MHQLLKERARSVTIRVGVDGVADDVEDLRNTEPGDLDFVHLATDEPRVEVQLGVVPYVSASDSQEARELARDVHSLVSVRKRPKWQRLAVITTFRILGFGPALTFSAIFLADGLGLISPSDHTRRVIGGMMPPAVLLGLLGATIAFKHWLKVDYATPVLPERQREIRSRTVQGRSGTQWQLVSGIALALVSSVLTLLSAWLTGFFGLKS
ncbi:hypothetical protein [Streptomyces platensis]|uniref:hypothetical protein n=1 Tax=Streptomyces platensis TaxID=58346 RepID=UPI002E821F34|nr:hypothetical protein [Streptomyces platensis]WUB80405.1 hypothetical protein OG424_15155 [Streptomyces platensis]